MSIKSIDNTNWIALSACYPYDNKIDLRPQLNSGAGYVFISHPILSKLKDTKAGKQTLFALTSATNLFDIFSATKSINNTDLIIYTAFLASNGGYISNINNTLYATATSISDTELFRVQRQNNNKYKIYYNTRVFTVDRNIPHNITLEEELSDDPYKTQTFDIFIDGDLGELFIMASFEAPWWEETGTPPRYLERFLSYSPITSAVRANGLIEDDDYFAINDYTFTTSVYIGDLTIGFDGNNRYVKYYNDFDNISNNKNTNIEASISAVKQNILIDTPYKTISNDKINTYFNVGRFDINFTTLKNIMTPEYEYTSAPLIKNNTLILNPSSNEAIKRREYEKMFIGTNQDEGYEKPYLEFNANTKSIKFEPDKCTFFHYPCSAPQIPLTAAGLIESGAFAGGTPIRSDRIKKKMANYAKNIWWGDSLGWQRGTWLCSWLSGSNNVDQRPVWKDRWYNPGYVQLSAALGEFIFVENDPVVIDIDSEMTFDPGVWYQYCHIGNNINKTLVDNLTGTGNNLRLNLNAWAETTPDESKFGNDGLLQSYDSNMIVDTFDGDVLKLNGIDQYCLVPYSSTYKTDDVSYTVWTNVNNWNNVEGNHIVSNNFRGGWSLGWTNGFNNTIVPVYDKTYGHILLHNLDGKILFDKLLPISGSNPDDPTEVFGLPVSIALDKNIFTWILDNRYKKLYQTDFDGNIINQYTFDSNQNLKDLVIDDKNNIWVLGNGLSSFNTSLQYLSTYSTAPAPEDAVFYYTFESGSLSDSSGNGIDAVLTGINKPTPTLGRDGELSGAYHFYGDVDPYDTTNISSRMYANSSINFGVSSFSGSCWFKSDNVHNFSSAVPSDIYQNRIMGKSFEGSTGYGTQGYVWLNVTQYGIAWLETALLPPPAPFINRYSTSFLTGPNVVDGNWHHIAFVVDRPAKLIKLYVDGQLQNQTSTTSWNPTWDFTTKGGLNTFWDKWSIGSQDVQTFCTRADITDINVYDFALNDEQIRDMYLYNPAGTHIDIKLDGSVEVYKCADVCIDNNNQEWIIPTDGTGVLKNSQYILSGIEASNIGCDKDNNIWLLFNDTSYAKLSSDGTMILSGNVTNNTTAGSRNITFTNEFIDGSYNDYVWILQGSERKIYKYDTDGIFVSDVLLTDGIDISQYINHNKGLMIFDTNCDPTGYDWYRKFKYLAHDKIPFIEANYVLGEIDPVSAVCLTYSVSNLTNRHWHHFASVYDSTNGTAKLYVDNILRTITTVNTGLPIYYEFENPLLIGSNIGKVDNLDSELQNNKYYFNGAIDDLRIYNTAINNFDIKNIYLTKYDFQDLVWNMPTGIQNYLEEIERFFKHKLPGMKSQYYNIRIAGLDITDETTKELIEDIIRNTVTKISPIYTELLNIIWE